MKRIVTFGVLAVAGFLAVAAPGRAATVDTYSFTDDGEYMFVFTSSGETILSALLPVTIDGRFTGTVDALGAIEQSDLTAFSVDATALLLGVAISGGLSDLSFFSFTPTGGDGTFNFSVTTGSGSVCAGFSAAFDPACANPAAKSLASAAIRVASPDGVNVESFVTSQVATLTLLSSVTTNPSGPAVPEPSTWSMVTLGFAAIGWMGRRRFQVMLAKHPA